MFDWLRRKPRLPPAETRDQTLVLEQLHLMKATSKGTGILYEAQRLQLDMWIWIALPHIQEHQLVVFPEDSATGTTDRLVEYIVKAKGKNPKDLDARLNMVDGYVKALLGDDMRMRVKINGELVFSSGPNV